MHDFSEPQTESGGMTRWLIIGGIVFVVLSIVFIVLSIIYPGFREAVRDLSIILLALFQLIGAIALALVAVAILYAVKAIDTTARTTLIPKLSEISTKVDELLAKTASVTDDVKKTSASYRRQSRLFRSKSSNRPFRSVASWRGSKPPPMY